MRAMLFAFVPEVIFGVFIVGVVIAMVVGRGGLVGMRVISMVVCMVIAMVVCMVIAMFVGVVIGRGGPVGMLVGVVIAMLVGVVIIDMVIRERLEHGRRAAGGLDQIIKPWLEIATDLHDEVRVGKGGDLIRGRIEGMGVAADRHQRGDRDMVTADILDDVREDAEGRHHTERVVVLCHGGWCERDQ
jgi:hypothetical protein